MYYLYIFIYIIIIIAHTITPIQSPALVIQFPGSFFHWITGTEFPHSCPNCNPVSKWIGSA